MKRAALLLWLAVGAAHAQPAVPPLTGRVVDRADILADNTEAALTTMLKAHEDSTSNQIAVLTVPSLNGMVLEEFATIVFRTWGLGRADLDNGVLVLIARDDRKIRIEVGYGLEGALPDATAGSIIRNEMTPRFRAGDFDGGTLAAVQAIMDSIAGEYTPSLDSDEPPWWLSLLFMLAMIFIPGAVLVRNMIVGPVQRYVFLLLFAPMITFMADTLVEDTFGVETGPVFFWVLGVFFVGYIAADVILSRTEWMQKKRRHHEKKMAAFRRARASGSTSVVVDGISYSVPTSSSDGGGFSGGGGSSGGGGASGGW